MALATDKVYTKEIAIPAGGLLASIDVRLNTTDNEIVGGLTSVLYANNGGVPGRLIGWCAQASDSFEFNGNDRWFTLPVGYYSAAGETVFVGIRVHDPASLTLAYETSGGNDPQVDAGGAWTIDPAATGGSVVDPGSHLYSIRASIIEGFGSLSRPGRTTVGASAITMTSGHYYCKKVTIPEKSLLVAIAAHIAQPTANVQGSVIHVWDDSSNAPGKTLHAGNGLSTSLLLSTTARWVFCPVGRWFETSQDVWIAIMKLGSAEWTIAGDTSGGADGTRDGPGDVGGAVFTAGDDDLSMHAVVLS